MKRILTLFLVCLIPMSVLCNAEELPKQCTLDCSVNYGETLGESASGVKAFSNCNNTCVNSAPFFVNNTFTGIKWQCVEYARRWLLKNFGVVYGDVDIAADIWNLEFVRVLGSEQQKTFKSILNGSRQHGLQTGDLLIYADAFYGTGHVAVVLKVDEQKHQVYVGEQNFNNQIWEGDYARTIPYVKRDDEIWLLDAYLLGWKRVILDK